MSRLRTSLLAACLGLAAISCGGGDDDDSGSGGLSAPAGLKVEPVAGPALHVTWTDLSNESGYLLERKEGTGAFVKRDEPIINAIMFHDADVTSGKTYTYRLAGTKADKSAGPFSPEVTATVP